MRCLYLDLVSLLFFRVATRILHGLFSWFWRKRFGALSDYFGYSFSCFLFFWHEIFFLFIVYMLDTWKNLIFRTGRNHFSSTLVSKVFWVLFCLVYFFFWLPLGFCTGFLVGFGGSGSMLSLSGTSMGFFFSSDMRGFPSVYCSHAWASGSRYLLSRPAAGFYYTSNNMSISSPVKVFMLFLSLD